MFKVGYLLVIFIGSCFAEIASWNADRTEFNLNHKHYSQHEASVHAARKGAAERLARIGGSSVVNPCGTTVCYGSAGFSENTDAETLGQGIVGFTGGSSGSSSSKYQSSAHHESVKGTVPVYPAAGSKSSYVSASQRSSSSSVSSGQPLNLISESEGIKTRSNFGATSGSTIVQPVISSAYPIGQELAQSSYASSNRESASGHYSVPVDTGSAYRTRSSYASASERDLSSVAQPVVSSGRQDYQRYTSPNTYVVYSKPVPVQVYTPVSSGFDSSARFSNVDSTVYTPVKPVYPVQSSSQYSSAEKHSYKAIAGQPQPVYGSSADRSSQSSSNYHSSGSYRPSYQPAYSGYVSGAERLDETNVRSSDDLAPVGVRTSSSNHQEERHEDYSRKGSTFVPIPVSSASTASKYSAHDERRSQAATSYVPRVPIAGISSESASKYANQEQRHSSSYTPVVVQPVGSASSTSSQYSSQQRRQHQGAGGAYYPVSGSDFGSRYSASDSQNAFNQHQIKGGNYVPYPITNDPLGMRFGATGIQLGENNDLGELMTESERLAKLQAKNAYNGAVAGSAAIDTENRFGGSSDGSANNLGGFQRTKSWSSSSKWASGQKYGDDGQVKSYSSLSTAESEQHNIDGKKTGYKAATTTLEDDGKVSTYSLHTP